jgi:GAF domain-containing protein
MRVLASSSDQMRVVELFEIQAREGPCLDCFLSGEQVVNQHLADAGERWPRFSPVALAAGYRSVHAFPVRLRHQVIGALNLFRADERPLDALDVAAGQAFADATAISILQQRALQDAHLLAGQLQAALDSRVLIEQAKGVIAERAQVSIVEAFTRIRAYARANNEKITTVSRQLVDGTLMLPNTPD